MFTLNNLQHTKKIQQYATAQANELDEIPSKKRKIMWLYDIMTSLW
jgi:hypothetical protein